MVSRSEVAEAVLVVATMVAVSVACDNSEPIVAPEPISPPLFGRLTIRRNDSQELVIERDPEIVHGGSEAFVLRDRITIVVPGRKLALLHVFHGLERGDLVEMDTEIHADGRTIYVRSDHALLGFDAWETWDPVDFDEEIRQLEVYVSCRVVGLDALGRLQANAHFGVRFVWRTE